MALVELVMSTTSLPQREKQLGSLRFLVWASFVVGGTNAAFLLGMQILSRLGQCDTRFAVNQGLWPLILAVTTHQALERPNIQMQVLGLVDVPSRWYPFSLAVGLSVMQGAVQWETFAAIAFGYVYHKLRLEDRLLLSARSACKFEERFPRIPGLLGALLGGAWITPNGLPPSRRGTGEHAERTAGNRGTRVNLFSGTGHRLGRD
mmetsp:Transcript_12779/g.22016  ORF Transcript_12779/g.22016 Transcript_12779/m.22016 type:complete len:205 (+) Transcript_12779:2-616(+)